MPIARFRRSNCRHNAEYVAINLLAVSRRFSAYQTNGEMFRQIEKDTLQLTISEYIWRIIIELNVEIAE